MPDDGDVGGNDGGTGIPCAGCGQPVTAAHTIQGRPEVLCADCYRDASPIAEGLHARRGVWPTMDQVLHWLHNRDLAEVRSLMGQAITAAEAAAMENPGGPGAETEDPEERWPEDIPVVTENPEAPESRAKYHHHRQLPPHIFEKKRIRTVPIEHTDYEGRYRRPGVKAVVGRIRKLHRPRYAKPGVRKPYQAWGIQSILTPKELKLSPTQEERARENAVKRKLHWPGGEVWSLRGTGGNPVTKREARAIASYADAAGDISRSAHERFEHGHHLDLNVDSERRTRLEELFRALENPAQCHACRHIRNPSFACSDCGVVCCIEHRDLHTHENPQSAPYFFGKIVGHAHMALPYASGKAHEFSEEYRRLAKETYWLLLDGEKREFRQDFPGIYRFIFAPPEKWTGQIVADVKKEMDSVVAQYGSIHAFAERGGESALRREKRRELRVRTYGERGSAVSAGENPEVVSEGERIPTDKAGKSRTPIIVGDRVYTYFGGFGGSVNVASGIVVQTKRGLAVKLTETAGMFGGADVSRKRPVRLTSDWTKEGEEHPVEKSMRESREGMERERLEFPARQAAFLKAVDDSISESKAAGGVHLDQVEPSAGMKVRDVTGTSTKGISPTTVGTVVGTSDEDDTVYVQWEGRRYFSDVDEHGHLIQVGDSVSRRYLVLVSPAGENPSFIPHTSEDYTRDEAERQAAELRASGRYSRVIIRRKPPDEGREMARVYVERAPGENPTKPEAASEAGKARDRETRARVLKATRVRGGFIVARDGKYGKPGLPKGKARKLAKRYRERGYYARVMPVKGGWAAFIGQKKPAGERKPLRVKYRHKPTAKSAERAKPKPPSKEKPTTVEFKTTRRAKRPELAARKHLIKTLKDINNEAMEAYGAGSFSALVDDDAKAGGYFEAMVSSLRSRVGPPSKQGDQKVFDALKDANYHTLNAVLSELGYYPDDVKGMGFTERLAKYRGLQKDARGVVTPTEEVPSVTMPGTEAGQTAEELAEAEAIASTFEGEDISETDAELAEAEAIASSFEGEEEFIGGGEAETELERMMGEQ